MLGENLWNTVKSDKNKKRNEIRKICKSCIYKIKIRVCVRSYSMMMSLPKLLTDFKTQGWS